MEVDHSAPFIKCSLVSICNFKTLSGGAAKMGVDGCIKGGVEQTFYHK